MIRRLLYPLLKHEPALRILVTVACLRNGTTLSKSGDTYLLCRGNKQIRIARHHLLYSIDLAKHFETYFSPIQPKKMGNCLEVDYSRPHLHTLANGLQFEISSLPEESAALDTYFRFYHPEPGDLVFDIGAYCGIFTHELSRAVGPSGRVVAFEPDPVNIESLRRNVSRHNLTNVTVVQEAISDREGETQFNSEGCLGSALNLSIDRPGAGVSVTVKTTTFENACKRFGTPAFVKIDAEGAEIEIINGSSNFLRKNSIHFALDTNHIRNSHTTDKAIEEIFHACGYEVESSEEFSFMTTWATPNSLPPHSDISS